MKYSIQRGLADTDLLVRNSDNAYIPFDENNTDYQNYLAWCAKGYIAPIVIAAEMENLSEVALAELRGQFPNLSESTLRMMLNLP